MNNYSKKAIEAIKNYRERNVKGELNCIPFPFKRFRKVCPGVEQRKYYLTTAAQKVGKTKFTDELFVYSPFEYMLANPNKLNIKWLYFSLEMSKFEKYSELMCRMLFKESGGIIHISTKDLRSLEENKPLPEEVLNMLESTKYQSILQKFDERMTIIEDIKNPFGIFKYCRDYALRHGTAEFEEFQGVDKLTREATTGKILNSYTPDDPNEYRIVIIDNASNFINEGSDSKMQTVDKMSKWCMDLKKWGFTVVLVQHQAQSQEGVENMKLNMMKPSANGLADCKTTIRDVDLCFGLYSPFRYGLNEYEGYDVKKLGDYGRFMEVIAGREGGGGSVCPLYFDGAVSLFQELPRSNDRAAMEGVYRAIRRYDDGLQISYVNFIREVNDIIKNRKKNGKSNWNTRTYWKW